MALDQRLTIRYLREKAERGEKITLLALYDFVLAALAEEAGIEGVIVGDSVAQALYGQEDTLRADMAMMIRHTEAVRRGAPNIFVIGDMPYMSYQPSVDRAVRNAGRFLAEGRADAVKLEGGTAVIDQIEAITKAGIPVVGHLGYLPQSAALAGGVRVETREAGAALQLVKEAMILDQAGIQLLILECVPDNVAAEVIKRVGVPVIGIGSGAACHGQVVLACDLLGLYPRPTPRFAEKYANLAASVVQAFRTYVDQTHSGGYPAAKHCYHMKPQQEEQFLKLLAELGPPAGG